MARTQTALRPLPDLIFGRPPREWSLPLLKQFLALFNKPLVPRQHRTTILVRLLDLEGETPLLKQYGVVQLIRRGAPLTREAIDAWPKEEAEEEAPDKEEPSRFCDACNDVLPASEYRRTKLTPECDHECTYCEECLRQAVNAQLSDEETDWDVLRCPTCKAVLRPETVRKYASVAVLSDYDEFRVSFHLRNMPNFCWCENATCHSGQIHLPGSKSPKMACVKCAFDTCFIHRLRWDEGNKPGHHNAATCASFHNDYTERAAIKKITKACPTCGIRVLKNGGCDHIQCTFCWSSFAWSLASSTTPDFQPDKQRPVPLQPNPHGLLLPNEEDLESDDEGLRWVPRLMREEYEYDEALGPMDTPPRDATAQVADLTEHQDEDSEESY